MKKLLPLLFICFLSLFSAKGQASKSADVINIDPVTQAIVLEGHNGTFYTLDLKFNKDIRGNILTLFYYSADHNIIYTKQLNSVLTGDLKFVDAVSAFLTKNQIVISIEIKDKIFAVKTQFMLIAVNAETGVITNSIIIEEMKKKFLYFNYTCVNEDSTKILYLYQMNNPSKHLLSYNYIIFDEKLTRLNSDIIKFPTTKVSGSITPGMFFYKESVYLWLTESRPTYKDATYLHKYDFSKKILTEIPFNLTNDYGLVLSLSKVNAIPHKGFILSGLVEKDGIDASYKGVFTAEFDANETLIEKRYFPFSEDLKSDYVIEKNRTSLSYMNMLQTYVSEKGDIYITLESLNVLFGMKETREDVTVLKIKRGVGIEWTKRIRKYEIAKTRLWQYHLGTSVFLKNETLYLVYRDNPDNKTVFELKPKEAEVGEETPRVRLVAINESGNVTSRFIADSYFEESKCQFYWTIPTNNKVTIIYKAPLPLTGNRDYLIRKGHVAFKLCNLEQ